MNILLPNYYKNFRCIADKCKNSCCIGWEIDIDEKTFEFYKELKTPLGEKIRKNISGEETPHFILGKNERCPFLDENGLCEIIRNMGEEATCDICRDHPRFRNFYENFTEMGLGLCCEEAARVILSYDAPFALESLEKGELFSVTEEEAYALSFREEVFEILKNREKTITERFEEISDMFGFSLSEVFSDAVVSKYKSLERLEESWSEYIGGISGDFEEASVMKDTRFSIFFEQLSVYFVFRHFAEGMYDESFAERIKFALSACFVIGAIITKEKKKSGEVSFSYAEDIARRFSAEVEYSEDNMDEIFDFFG